MATKKLLAGVFAAGLATAGLAGTATAAPPAGTACQQAGISTLQSLGLLPAVAKGGIEVVGIGVVAYRDVLALHRSNPELFQSGTGVTVVVPGVGEVAATWCD